MATRSDKFDVLFSELLMEDNTRYDYGDLMELANSIAENGVKQAIHTFKKKDSLPAKYVITDGHRRYKAIELGIQKGIINKDELKIPMIKETIVSDEKRALGFLLYNDGKRLTMLEEAMVYERLITICGYTEIDIKNKTGKSLTHVKNQILLLSATKPLKELIMNGTIKATLVIELLKEGKTSQEIVDSVKAAVDSKKGNHSEVEDSTTGDMSGAASINPDNISDTKKNEENANVKTKPASKLKEDSGKPKITKKDLAGEKKNMIKIEEKVLQNEVQELAAMDGVNKGKIDALIAFTAYLTGDMTMDDLKELLK